MHFYLVVGCLLQAGEKTCSQLKLGDNRETADCRPMLNQAIVYELQGCWFIHAFQVMDMGSYIENAQATFGICGLRNCSEPHLWLREFQPVRKCKVNQAAEARRVDSLQRQRT